jgi:FimV-like protein
MEVDARMLRRPVNVLTTLLALVLSGSVPVSFGQEAPGPEQPPVPVEKPVPEENIYRTGSGETRLVRTGETLMSIAREWSTTTGTTLAQTMVSIYRNNPEAFGNGMSDMQRGAALRLPSPEQIRAVPAAEAMSEVSRQLNIWRTQVVPPQAPSAAPKIVTPAPVTPVNTPPARTIATPAPATPVVTPSPTASAESRVRLVPPAQVTPEPVVAITPEAQALMALEQRMARIEAQLAESKRLLEERSKELQQLQARAAQAESWQSTLASLWWLSPIFIVISLVLALALWLRSRRAERDLSTAQATVEPAKEMTFDLPPIKPAATMSEPVVSPSPVMSTDPLLANDVMPDALMRAPANRAAPVVEPPSLDPLDLEGDPPPLNEAGSMIDLARAYIEMGDYRSALLELQAALKIGDEAQRAEALRLLDSLPKS